MKTSRVTMNNDSLDRKGPGSARPEGNPGFLIVPPRLELEGTRLFQAVENRDVQVRLIDGKLLEEVVQASGVGDERRLLKDERDQKLVFDADIEDAVGVSEVRQARMSLRVQ